MCLIGAPGAHKTEIAEKFEEASKAFFDEHDIAPLAVVDTNHMLSDMQGRVSGKDGDHYSTLANYFNRILLEDRVRARGDSFISVGSLIDAVAHLNVRIQMLGNGIQHEASEAMAQREFLVGNLLQSYFMDGRWAVNFAWYVPLAEKIVIPGADTPDTYNAEVDAVIRDINLKMQLGIPVLLGTVDEMVEQMVADLRKHYTGQTRSDLEEMEHVVLGVSDDAAGVSVSE
jgi:hypothetical protein